VVGADGSLKGYAGGIPLKARLLGFEASHKPLSA
jgi:O6-methylguanine-DNA--protein-cysteine methyltransferase